MTTGRALYVGAYTVGAGGDADGVGVLTHDPVTGAWTSSRGDAEPTGVIAALTAAGDAPQSPSYLAWHPDGRHLTVTYTWNDPKVYVKPHAYQIPFERVPGDGYVLENWCDASIPHPEMVQSIVPPEQLTEGNR